MPSKKLKNNTVRAVCKILAHLLIHRKKVVVKECAVIGGCSVNTAMMIMDMLTAYGLVNKSEIRNDWGQQNVAAYKIDKIGRKWIAFLKKNEDMIEAMEK